MSFPSISSAKALLLILAASALTYLPFVNSPLFWDDEQFIYSNQYVRQFALQEIFTTSTTDGAGEPSNYYRPLTTLSFAIDHQLWGLNPVGFHLTNLMLHAGAGMALFLVLKLLKINQLAALAISILFIMHPIQTETVSYANSRGDSIFTLFGLLGMGSLLMLMRMELSQKKEINLQIKDFSAQINKGIFVIGAIGFYIAAILGKEIGLAVLGLYWLGVIYWWLSQQFNQHALKLTNWLKRYSNTLITLLTTTAVAAGYLALRSGPLKFQEQLNPYPPGHPYGDSVVVRLSTFAKVIFIYLRLLVAPFRLHMERTTELVLSPFSGWVVGALLLGLAAGVVGWAEYRRHRRLLVWMGSAWFLAMLVPVSGIVPINDILYEHWLYLPSVGFWMVLYGLIRLIIDDQSKISQVAKRILNKFGHMAYGVILLGCLTLSWRQNYIWADPIRFYNYTLQFNQTARMQNNLGMAYADKGQLNKALEHYQAALEINSTYAQIHNNLANTYANLGQLELAKESYQEALELNPVLMQSNFGLISVLIELEEFDQALEFVSHIEELGLPAELATQLRFEIDSAR